MFSKYNVYFLLFILLFIYSCGAIKPYYQKHWKDWEQQSMPTANLRHTVFLIGDTGSPLLDQSAPVLNMLDYKLTQLDQKSGSAPDSNRSKHAVIYLGDNIYYHGLPPPDAPDRQAKETIINRQMDAVKDHQARLFFIPGNHGWNFSSAGGLGSILRQEKYIEDYLNNNDVFYPKGGCPGPVTVALGPDLLLLFVNSEWWLTKQDKPIGLDDCGIESNLDFLVQIDDILKNNQDKHILLNIHHPLFSNGNHGGHFSLKDHIFPLTIKRPYLYLPLPLIGSLYPLMRMYGISRQDIPNPTYQQLKNSLLSLIQDYDNLVLASGHDHNLQYHTYHQTHHIISGSGSKTGFAVKGYDAAFVHQSYGLAQLSYFENGEVWLEFWVPDPKNPDGKSTFRYPLYALEPAVHENFTAKAIDYQDSSRIIAPGINYKANVFNRFMLGKYWREVWQQQVEVPYLQLDQVAGGLTPVKKGGGQETVSLRFKNPEGIQYNFRSVNKNPGGVLPGGLKKTFAEGLVQDQISASYPYGALAVSGLEKALGLYYTDPKLYYMPHDPQLGPYLEEFGGMLGMLEIRPDEDLSHLERFGHSENVVSSSTLYEHLMEDHDHEVDQKMFLKARLLDILVGDWDRHEDQWRWAEFEKEKGSLFKPVSRDRDKAFSIYDGLLPRLISKPWGLRKLSSFEKEYEDLLGLNYNARSIDRYLLNELSLDQWLALVDTIQDQLSEPVIKSALAEIPAGALEVSGAYLYQTLTARLKKLDDAARSYYYLLANEVEIIGTDQDELFLLTFQPNEQLNLKMYQKDKSGDLMYTRTFKPGETEEVIVFGLGGADRFQITGSGPRSVKVRIVGGSGPDQYFDNVPDPKGKKVIYYDQKAENNLISKGSGTNLEYLKNQNFQIYQKDRFNYNYKGPQFYIGYNKDDGITPVGGITFQYHDFGKESYSSLYNLNVKYAFNLKALQLEYKSLYNLFIKNKLDFGLDLDVMGPNNQINYFGQGGQTEFNQNIQYYRVRLNDMNLFASLQYRVSPDFRVGIGPFLNYNKVFSESNTILNSEVMEGSTRFASEWFAGGKAFTWLNLVDDTTYPTRGVLWNNSLEYYQSTTADSYNFLKVQSDLSFYYTPNLPFDLTFALRFGAATNIGQFRFYQSNFLGGLENLRGYRMTRFAGKSVFYQNSELRWKINAFSGYYLTGSWGLAGFIDHGKIWTESEQQEVWRKGYGPGLWFNFYDLLLLSGYYTISSENNLFNLRMGFYF
ncbi:MAG: hypothetical protein ACNS62_14960 [Candidatus Cyclobacteriaceae bacterium M3_2C_046]